MKATEAGREQHVVTRPAREVRVGEGDRVGLVVRPLNCSWMIGARCRILADRRGFVVGSERLDRWQSVPGLKARIMHRVDVSGTRSAAGSDLDVYPGVARFLGAPPETPEPALSSAYFVGRGRLEALRWAMMSEPAATKRRMRAKKCDRFNFESRTSHIASHASMSSGADFLCSARGAGRTAHPQPSPWKWWHQSTD